MEGRQPLIEVLGPMVGGVHGGLHPSLLSENQFAAGVNITARGGFIATRPGFKRLLDLGLGFFQGAGRYRLNEGDRLIFVQDGKVKQIKLFEEPLQVQEYTVASTTRTKFDINRPVYDVPPPDPENPPTPTGYEAVTFVQEHSPDFGKDLEGNWSRVVNMTKAERFFVVQDGYHQPVIIPGEELVGNGASAVSRPLSADTARVSFQSPIDYPALPPGFSSTDFHFSEVPIGLSMSYASRRLVVSPRWEWQDLIGTYPADIDDRISGRATFVASDVDISVGACLRFVENNFANGGGSISLPLESGFITCMAPFRNSEAVDGNGALVVFGQDGVSAFNLAFDRRTWGDDKQAISQMLFQDVGSESPRALVPVNDDLFFRRPDGIASLRYTATQAGGKTGSLSTTPQSFEVSHRLNLDSFESLPLVSMDFTDNRLFVTSGGLTPGGQGFRGLVVLDGSSVYSMTSEAQPIYNDIWTGLDFLQLVHGRYQGKTVQFVFAKCVDGSLSLWALDPEAKMDDGNTLIPARLYTRQYAFGNSNFKKFSKCELYIRDLVGEAEISLYWRADGYYLWKKCNVVQVNSDVSGLPQSRYRITLSPTEENPCDEATGRPLRAGTSFQFCLEWRGSLKIEKALFFADLETANEPVVQCDPEMAVALVESDRSGVSLDDFEYCIGSSS
jgi:hypothetical protein